MIGQITTQTAKSEQDGGMENSKSLASLSVTSHGFALFFVLLLHDDLNFPNVKIRLITSVGGEEHFKRFTENTVALILNMADLKKIRIPRDGSG